MAAPTKTTVAFNNRMRESYITSIGYGGFVPDVGYPIDNLKYDNPYQVLKVSTTPSSDPSIVIAFNAVHSFESFGVFAHTLNSRAEGSTGYDSVTLEYDDDSPNGDWVLAGGVSLSGQQYGQDLNYLTIADTNFGSSDRWRVRLNTLFDNAFPFILGGLFLGEKYEFFSEIEDGGFNSVKQSDIVYSRSRHVRHVSSWPDRPIYDGQLVVSQGHKAQLAQMDYIQRTNMGRIIGIKQAEQIASELPQTNEHFFGRIVKITDRPRVGWPATMDMVVDLEGL